MDNSDKYYWMIGVSWKEIPIFVPVSECKLYDTLYQMRIITPSSFRKNYYNTEEDMLLSVKSLFEVALQH